MDWPPQATIQAKIMVMLKKGFDRRRQKREVVSKYLRMVIYIFYHFSRNYVGQLRHYKEYSHLEFNTLPLEPIHPASLQLFFYKSEFPQIFSLFPTLPPTSLYPQAPPTSHRPAQRISACRCRSLQLPADSECIPKQENKQQTMG